MQITKNPERRTVDPQVQGGALAFLYRTVPGRMVLKLLTARWISKVAGFLLDRGISRPLISSFIRNNNIDMEQFIPEEYPSFNACFIRRIKPECRPIDTEAGHLVAPCDAKLSVFPITQDACFDIKGSLYRVSDLLDGDQSADSFCGGQCLIFRLAVEDYHRYMFHDDGQILRTRFVPGQLHTVQPIALEHYNIYKRNCRAYTVIQTEHFGLTAQIEVGALLVGRIVNHKQDGAIKRGEEKGYFCYGGSTVVLLLQPDVAVLDEELIRNTANGLETVVRYGECIGTAVQ